MKQAFHGEVYDTANAILLASHDPPSGIRALKGQLVLDLYRTPSGSYFNYETIASLFSEEEGSEIVAIRPQEALSLYKRLADKLLPLEDAFPLCLMIR